jgi:hypothetical protein
LFVLAWACSQRALDEPAAKLYAEAFDPRYDRPGEDQEKVRKTLREQVADDLAHTEMWRGVLQFGDPKVPRRDLLSRFERLTKSFPKSKYHDRASEAVVLLKKMIEEDEEHARHRKEGKPFDQLGKEEQIAELIFQLREQNGHQFMQPGHCDILDRFGGENNDTAAHKLVKIGYDAVPQLIEHLDDKRFTRSVGYHRNFYFSHHVLRVCDCSLVILEEIAGLSFWQPKSTFSYISLDKDGGGEVKKKVDAWYAVFKMKGEKGFLSEATERGAGNSAEMGRRLLEKYPKEALPLLLKGARACKEGSTRATLVGLIASCQGDEPLQFLLTELKDGPLAQPRLVAAEELHKRGRPEGLSAMIAWWEKAHGAEVGDGDPASWSHFIAEYLSACGEDSAIRALGMDIRKLSVKLRFHVIECVGGHRTYPIEAVPPKDPVKVQAAAEELLVTALDDTEEYFEASGTPRVCDIAGHYLSKLLPEKYTFDYSASVTVRTRQLVVMKNVWRVAHKLPPLPMPEPKKIAAVPVETLRPLLDRYLASSGEDRISTEKEVAKFGPGALPGVIDRRDKAPDKRDQATWNELAGRLASIVAEVEFYEQSTKPTTTVKERLDALKGKPLDPGALIKTLGFMAKNGQNDVQGVRLYAVRTEDGTGFSLKLELTAAPKDAQGPPTQWGFSESISVGKKHLRAQHRASSGDGLKQWTEGDYPELMKVLEEVVASAPDQPVQIRISITPQWRK